jgi:hypothetical protein
MSGQPFALHSVRARHSALSVLLGLLTLIATAAGAQQQKTYMLELNGQQVPLESIAFGGIGSNQPNSGAAVLRMHTATGESPLSQLAQAGSQTRLLVQFRDPQSNSIVHYEFDDVRFGRVRQIGQGPGAMDTLEINYTSFNVNTPGSFRRPTGTSRRVTPASRQHNTRAASHRNVRLPHIKKGKQIRVP